MSEPGRHAEGLCLAWHSETGETADQRDPPSWELNVVPERELPEQKSIRVGRDSGLDPSVRYRRSRGCGWRDVRARSVNVPGIACSELNGCPERPGGLYHRPGQHGTGHQQLLHHVPFVLFVSRSGPRPRFLHVPSSGRGRPATEAIRPAPRTQCPRGGARPESGPRLTDRSR